MHCAVNSRICGQGPDNRGKKIKRSPVPPLTCECGKPLPVSLGHAGYENRRTPSTRRAIVALRSMRSLRSPYFLRLRVPPGAPPAARGSRPPARPRRHSPAAPPCPAPPNRPRYRPVSSALPMVADGGAPGPAGRSPGGSPDGWHCSGRWGCAESRAAGAARPRSPLAARRRDPAGCRSSRPR